MIHETEFNEDVIDAFDIGHGRYIETASGVRHMYFLLGTDTKTINNGMRCKDYLQEVFLTKRFKRCKTGGVIYGFNLRGIRDATRLYLKFPHVNMLDFESNIHKCIAYINNTYNINISVSVLSQYVELRMPINWFTDKINPVEASAISTLLRSCMIWEYNSLEEIRDNIDELEDKYDHLFPEKDWNGRGEWQLDYLSNTLAQRVLGRWDFCSKSVKSTPDQSYHNGSGWASAAGHYRTRKFDEATLSLIDKMKPSSTVSDQCILFIGNKDAKAVQNRIIKNKKDLRIVLNRLGKKSIEKRDSNDRQIYLIFNNAIINNSNTCWNYHDTFANDSAPCRRSLQFTTYGLGSALNAKSIVLTKYENIRLARLMNSLSYECVFDLNKSNNIRSLVSDRTYDEYCNEVYSRIVSSKVSSIVKKNDILKKVYNKFSI